MHAMKSIIATTKLIMTLGTSTILPGNPQQIWVENKHVVKAEAKSGRIWLRPQKPGFSMLRTQEKTFEISILTSFEHAFYNGLQLPFGLKKSIEGGYPVLQGDLFRFADLQSVLEQSLLRQVRLRLQLDLTESQKRHYLHFINQQISKRGLKSYKLTWHNQSYNTKINPKQDQASRAAYEFLGVRVDESESQLQQEPTVKVSITVAEVKRSFSQKLGLKPPTSYSATLLADGTLEKESGFDFNLQALEARGQARILASPNIICRSGKEAEFFAGGEFPIKILNYKTQDVIWKKFGISLKVKPQADYSGQINLSIETEVSNLDTSTTVDGIPGITANRLSSHFDLQESKTIALSGLLKEESGNSQEGWPWLQRVPVLGALFSSQDYRDQKTELIVFVRPEILLEDSTPTPASHLDQGVFR